MYRGLRTGTRTSRTIAEEKGTDPSKFVDETPYNYQAGVPTSAPGGSDTYHDAVLPAIETGAKSVAEKSPFANVKRGKNAKR